MVHQLKQLPVRPESTIRDGDLEFRRLLDKLPGGAYTCDRDGLITYFNQHAAELWGREPRLNDPIDRFCGSFKLFSPDGRPITHDQCWMALTLRNDRGYNGEEIVIERPNGERLTVLAHANPIHDASGNLTGSVNVLVDITAQKETEHAVHRLNASLAEQVAESTAALGILRDVAVAANEARTVEEALLVALRRVCDYNGWLVGHAWQRADCGSDEFVSSGVWHFGTADLDRLRALHGFREVTEATRIPIGGGFIGRVARTAAPVWFDDVVASTRWRRGDPRRFGLTTATAFPVLVQENVVAVLEFFSNQPLQRDERFAEVMPDVGIQLGHVFERKHLEKAIADATAEQQHRIARELHDSVSQLLTGAAMMGESLRQALDDASSPQAELAMKLVRCLGDAQQQVRHVSRGLMPVEADAAGLMNALGQLAERCSDMYGVPCVLECPEPVLVENDTLATQLYYIGSEALHNAVKHANATSITLRLENDSESVRLVIADDGRGMPGGATSSTGMGRSIMGYRASVIGGKLDVRSESEKGTRVICTVPVNAARTTSAIDAAESR